MLCLSPLSSFGWVVAKHLRWGSPCLIEGVLWNVSLTYDPHYGVSVTVMVGLDPTVAVGVAVGVFVGTTMVSVGVG
jgi:hypothetical protein